MTVRSVVTVLVCLFPISEAILSFRARSGKRIVCRADEGSLALVWLTITFSVSLAVLARALVPGAAFPGDPFVLDGLSLFLISSGLLLRWTSILTLGRFFTVDVAIHEGHGLVERGPYRYVRHPSYTGVLITFFGLGVYLGNWVGLGALMIPIVLALSSRIRTEEAALMKALGPAYARYAAKTARLIPGLY